MTAVSTSDGISLEVGEAGEGPAVVLIAGYSAPASTWVFQTDALVSAGYRAVSLDRRSHGRSDAPWFGQRMARHGKDLHDVLVGLDLTEVVLVGGSMGASTIWACLDLFGTDRVRGVVSVDQTPRMRNGVDWPYGFYGFDDGNAGTLFADGVPDTGRGRALDRSSEAVGRLLARLGPEAGLPTPRPETLPLLRDHAQQDWRDVIARTEVPVLMVGARDSQVWPCEHAEAAVRDNRSGWAVVLEDCGHAANIDQPDAFNAAMLAFLGDL